MSNQLATTHDFVLAQEKFFQNALTDQRIKWQKESQFAIQLLQKNNYLADIAMKNQASFQNAIINVAAIGISLNPAQKLAYLVPRDGAVCLDISYMGLLHLAMDAGAITWGQCRLVHENDTYENQGLDKAPIHKYSAFKDRGEVIGGYCTVKTPSGDYLTEEMSVDQINEIRDKSAGYKAWLAKKAKSCPWVDFWGEMARKTIVKRAAKYWPKVERLDNAIEYLNIQAEEGLEEIPVTCSEYQQKQITEKANKLDIPLQNILRGAKVKSVEEIEQSLATRIINKLSDMIGCIWSIEEMRKAFDAEDYCYFYQLFDELDEYEKDAVLIAPTKGGPLTVEQRNKLMEMFRAEAAEKAKEYSENEA